MPVVTDESLLLAIRNVAYWGDTDVLPFPIENHWFHDAEDDVHRLLSGLDKKFDEWLTQYPILSFRGLSSVGYTGYRGATQIDPIWNAYLLALTIELGTDVEGCRCALEKERVYSYRFAPDPERYTLFNTDIGWHAFQARALQRAEEGGVVLSTDITDFYPRVYHHRVDNALSQVTANKEAVRRIMEILKRLSVGGVSYGLPIGGNASRILAEALLNRTDRLLLSRNVDFCRFVDDYFIFAPTLEKARQGLVHLSEALLTHEGLSLSRSKTRLMTAQEFLSVSPAALPEESEAENEETARHFLRIRLKYDPYSPTSDEDYDKLVEELRRFDVVGMLAREMRKSRVDESLTKQLVKSLRYLDSDVQADAVDSLMLNLEVLFPVFPTVAIVVRGILDNLGRSVTARVFSALRSLVRQKSHILQVHANMAFAVRLLARDPSEESDQILAGIYDDVPSMLIRRDVILAMAAQGRDYWVADRLRHWSTLTPWERRSLIPGSYILGDEGSHWRKAHREELNHVDASFMKWVGEKNNGGPWAIPL